MEYELTYDIDNELLLIGLETESQFKQINNYIKNNLKLLNEGKELNFIDKG